MDHNRLLAAILAHRVDAVPQQCYRNSVLALFALQEEEGQEAYYVEGWLDILGAPLYIEHGWLEVDGQLVDVTLLDLLPEAYHPVLRQSRERIREEMKHGSTSLPLYLKSRESQMLMHQKQAQLYGYSIKA